MRQKDGMIFKAVFGLLMVVAAPYLWAQDVSDFEIELETGQVWQSYNEVQIPNTAAGTRFSLVDIAGQGPVPVTRLYVTWNMDDKQSFRALYAPLSYTKTGTLASSVDFAGQTYTAGSIDATYKFNSYRLSYRYRYMDDDDLQLWVGFTAKIRDAKIELTQGSTTSNSTDLGFVPLLHLGADWALVGAWHLLFDFDGLAGGPGRAFDIALKLNYDINDAWGLSAGYRTIEGGADVESVYNFAWLHFAVVSINYRF